MSDQSQDRRSRGLHGKFHVTRTDGTSAPGCKHDGCSYFVLDLTHDKFAQPAVRAYAAACAAEYPLLAADLWGKFPGEGGVPASTFHLDAEASALVDRIAAAYRLTRGGAVLHALRSLELPGEAEPSPAAPPPVRPTSPFYEAMAVVNERRRSLAEALAGDRDPPPDRALAPGYAVEPPTPSANAAAGAPLSAAAGAFGSAPSRQLQQLPHGVRQDAAGAYVARCRSCGRSYELFGPPEAFTEEGNVCGGSDRCTL